MEELLEYEIESILLNRVRDVFSHHQRMTIACNAFCHAVSSSVKKERGRKHDYTKKIEDNASIIANTSSRLKNVHDELATAALQQKVLEKQINKIRTQQGKLMREIEEGKSEEHDHALEIVDLEQDVEEIKTNTKLKWDAIKKAIQTYKSALGFSIGITDSSETCNKVRVIFFKPEKDDNIQYYADLTHTTDLWRVDLIHPSLKPKHEEQLKCVVNFKKQQEVSDITAFLCILREIFKQQRAKPEDHSSV